jgi:hypothetical protein
MELQRFLSSKRRLPGPQTWGRMLLVHWKLSRLSRKVIAGHRDTVKNLKDSVILRSDKAVVISPMTDVLELGVISYVHIG